MEADGRRLSEFNYIVKRPDCTLGYNLYSGNFIVLDTLSQQVISQESDFKKLSDESLKLLETAGFIVRENERDSIQKRLRAARPKHQYSHIVITPTIACNFRCGYCFQNDMRSSEQISDPVLDRIIDYVAVAVERGGQRPKITWFGGEPLLAIERIETFNKKMIERISLDLIPAQDIITNGSLLDQSMIERLQHLRIRRAQISFDSVFFAKATHRGILNADGSPSIISINALSAIAHGFEVIVRVNIDARNSEKIASFMEALKSVGLDKYAYYARVEDDNGGANIPIRQSEFPVIPIAELTDYSHTTISREAYAKREKELLFNRQNFSLLLQKLKPRLHFCGATDGTMMIVSPSGGISRCWNSAGRQNEEIGNIIDVDLINKLEIGHVNASWDLFSPFDHEGCRECKVVPICMGGCSHPRNMLGIEDPPCTPVKYYIDELVQYVGTHLSIGNISK